MITLSELTHYLEELLQSSKISDYCPNGIQIEGRENIKKIATAVSASLETITSAATLQADVLIVHHGLFWNKDSYEIKSAKRDKIKQLLQNDITLLAYHLPLDAHQELGNNWKAAKDLGWRDLRPFCMINGLPIGVRGVIDPIPREVFKKSLEIYYKHPAVCALGGDNLITTVGLVSGGAHYNIKDAIAEGLSCYITGSFDEPIWHIAHEEKINFFAMGHAATEWIGPKALGEHLGDKFGIESIFIDSVNPF